MKATTTIPIVMTNSVDPVSAGLVASPARPGGDVPGLAPTRRAGPGRWRCRLQFGRGGCFRLGNGLLGDDVAFICSHRFLLYWRRGIRRFFSSTSAVRTLDGDVAFGLDIARQSGWEAHDNQDGESVSRRDDHCREDCRAQEFCWC